MQVKSATELLLNKTFEEVWYRGQEYADSGRARIVKADEKEVQAVVEGTKKYTVKLKFVVNGIRRDCPCLYPKGICKHDGVWIFPEVRIGKIVLVFLEKYPQNPAWAEFREIVETVGDWWGESNLNEKVISQWADKKL